MSAEIIAFFTTHGPMTAGDAIKRGLPGTRKTKPTRDGRNAIERAVAATRIDAWTQNTLNSLVVSGKLTKQKELRLIERSHGLPPRRLHLFVYRVADCNEVAKLTKSKKETING